MVSTNKIGVLVLFVAVVCAGTPILVPNAFAAPLQKPKLVSLDSCADQLVLHMADDEQILALSPNSQLPFSFYKTRAVNFATHGGTAEEVLSLMPDVALRTGVGDYALARMLSRMGVETVATGLPDTIAGIKGDVTIFGEAMAQVERAKELIDNIDSRYQQAQKNAGDFKHLKALYLSPGGTTTGENTFVGEVIKISGLTNLMSTSISGWGQIDIEKLVLDPPDVIVGSFFDAQVGNADGWRFSHHPVVTAMMEHALFIDVPSRFLACPQWMMLDAVEFIQSKLEEERGNVEK